MNPIEVTVLVPTQCMASSLALTFDVLDTANRVLRSLGATKSFQITELPVKAGVHPGSPHILVLPGLGLSSEVDVMAALNNGMLRTIADIIKKIDFSRTVIATSCSGVFALAQSGLADQRRITTTWWLAPLMREHYPKPNIQTNEMVIEDGPIITAGAALAHIDLMIHLVERFMGTAVAHRCRRFLVADERPSQMPYISTAIMISSDPALQKAENYVTSHIASVISADDMAKAAGLGLRTFARRLKLIAGLTPTQFLQSVRVSHATGLASNSSLSSDEIASRVGYSDASALRRVMKNHTGKTIADIR